MKDDSKRLTFAAIVIAAGKSSRMGRPKMNLPWKGTTILGAIIRTLNESEIDKVTIVINPFRVPELGSELNNFKYSLVPNPAAENSEMLSSIQAGIKAIPDDVDYIFICLGDQPQLEKNVLCQLKELAQKTHDPIIIPSYRMRRGHPWLVKQDLLHEITSLDKNDTVRTFINTHNNEICYLNLDQDIPEDMDTPEDYKKLLQRYG